MGVKEFSKSNSNSVCEVAVIAALMGSPMASDITSALGPNSDYAPSNYIRTIVGNKVDNQSYRTSYDGSNLLTSSIGEKFSIEEKHSIITQFADELVSKTSDIPIKYAEVLNNNWEDLLL